MERTFVMIKPDGVKRGLVGELITRIEKRGFKITAMKMLTLTREMSKEHYAEHVNKGFYPKLEEYITSGPVVAMVVEGKNSVSAIRTMMGKTNPLEAAPGTIRGDYAIEIGRNVIHGSDAVESAEREISIYFSQEEINKYQRCDEGLLYE